MLENLRDKFYNVQQDISASFRNLTTGQGQSSYKNRKNSTKNDITLNAGADLLNYYQKQWEQLHLDDVENAKKAEEVDELIYTVHHRCQEQLSHIRQLNIHLCSLPKLQANIMDLMVKIGELEGMFEEVEDALVNLEDVIETQELQERQLDHRFQLAMYEKKRLVDFENFTVKLAQEHTDKVVEFEKRQQVILQERQHTFQEAFEAEVEIFKKQGINKLKERISSGNSKPVSLESIELADDAAALDEFLGNEDLDAEVFTKNIKDFQKTDDDSKSNETAATFAN